MYEISPAIYGAANLSSGGPILSVPVVLHESIDERYLNTLSFSILLMVNCLVKLAQEKMLLGKLII